MSERLRAFIEQQNERYRQETSESMTHDASSSQVSPELIESTMSPHERIMNTSTPAYLASKAASGMLESGAGLVDEWGRAIKGDTMPGPDGQPVFRRPAAAAVDPYLTDFGKVEENASPIKRALGSAAEFGGKLAPDAAAVAVGGGVIGGGLKLLGKVPAAFGRLQQMLNAAGNATIRAGGGKAPLPGGNDYTNLILRATGGATAGAAGGALTNPEEPVPGAAMGGAVGAVAGPAMNVAGRGLNMAGDILIDSRAPMLADEFLRRSMGPTAPAARQQLAAHAANPSELPRMPAEMLLGDTNAQGIHKFLMSNDDAYRLRFAENRNAQGETLRNQFDTRTADLDADRAARAAAVASERDFLQRSTVPIPMNARGSQGMSPQDTLTDIAERYSGDPNIIPDVNRVTARIRPPRSENELLSEVPGRTAFSAHQGMHRATRSAYELNAPNRISEESVGPVNEFRQTFGDALSRPEGPVSPDRAQFADVFRGFNEKFRTMSIPVNQKEKLKEIIEAARSNTNVLRSGREAIEPGAFHAKVNAMKEKPEVWNQLTPEQQHFIDRVDLEMRQNMTVGENASNVTRNMPWGLRNPTGRSEVDPGRLAAVPGYEGALLLGRSLGEGQRARILANAGEIMSNPQTLQQLLDDIMAGRTRQYPVTAGISRATGTALPAYFTNRNR